MRLSCEYIAAFIDCDGCISIVKASPKKVKSAPSYYARVGFYSQNLSVLKEIQEVMGGTICLPRSHACYNLQLPPSATVVCLKAVRPYLRIKGDQADVALSLHRHLDENPVRGNHREGRRLTPPEFLEYRESLLRTMKMLNHRDSQDIWKNRVNSAKAPRGVIPSQAVVGEGATEGVTTRVVTPKNNLPQEDPTGNGRDSLDNAIPTVH